MYKYRRLFFVLITLLYSVLSLIELIKYCFTDSNMFGLIYLIITLIILFLLLPTLYNYKNNYSNARLSKFIIIIMIGAFNSFVLYSIVVNNMRYEDSSNIFRDSIFWIKNVFKPIVYFGLVLLALRDAKLYRKIKRIINDKKIVD